MSQHIQENNSDILLVSFAGNALQMGGIAQFEFLRFINEHFPHIDSHFYKDNTRNNYHYGIEGISTTIEETAEYFTRLKSKYKKIIFMGASGGGYAAILFGSLVNIDKVIAFFPPTICIKSGLVEKYRNLKGFINTTTEYFLYGDESVKDTISPHHISHCENVSIYPNVHLIRKKGIELKRMRTTGELFNIINSALN